jgi:hypothetical protein
MRICGDTVAITLLHTLLMSAHLFVNDALETVTGVSEYFDESTKWVSIT